MPIFSEARILPCEIATAWNAVTDFPSRTLHSARYRRAHLPDGPNLEPGHRLELQIGRDRFTSLVTDVREAQSLTHRAVGPGFWVEYAYTLRECSDSDHGYSSDDMGYAHLTIAAEYGGWLGALIAALRPGACRRYLADEMSAIVSAALFIPAEPADIDS